MTGTPARAANVWKCRITYSGRSGAVLAGEHEVVVGPRRPLCELPLPVLNEIPDGYRVERRDTAASLRFRGAHDQASAEFDNLLDDREGTGLEVHVLPPQARRKSAFRGLQPLAVAIGANSRT